MYRMAAIMIIIIAIIIVPIMNTTTIIMIMTIIVTAMIMITAKKKSLYVKRKMYVGKDRITLTLAEVKPAAVKKSVNSKKGSYTIV